MAQKGQTHSKRARELALKERRERKQAKKEARAAGNVSTDESDAGVLDAEEPPETMPETIQ